MRDKYSDLDELAALGFLTNSMHDRHGDRGAFFPRSDAEDLSRGLRFIPGEVTVARRRGEYVEFVQDCWRPLCWYWQFPDGGRTYYWESHQYEALAEENGIELETSEWGSLTGNPGACRFCGNEHTMGGYFTAEEL